MMIMQVFWKSLLSLTMLLIVAACNSESILLSQNLKDVFQVDGIDTISADVGDAITVKGRNFKPLMKASIGGLDANFEAMSANEGKLTVPDGVGAGMQTIVFSLQDKYLVKRPLLIGTAEGLIKTPSAEDL